MSRYGDPRYSVGSIPYRDAPPNPNRWDAERLTRERDSRVYYDDYYGGPPPQVEPPRRSARPAPVAPVYEDRERAYYEDDRYGPRGSRVERRYFEEDDYYDPRTRHAQLVPYRPERPPRPEAPPRPGVVRRQSSLDTFDRPPRRYEDYGPPPQRPQRVDMRVPDPPNPRDNRYRPPQRMPARDYQRQYYDYYDDIAIQDPDYYGDDGYREYREREWISSKRRDSPSPARSKATTEKEEVVEEKEEKSVKSGKGGKEVKEEKETVVEEKEEKGEKPFPRRGKTKMPKRLVHTKVLHELGYEFFEEDEKTIIVKVALGPDNIDEILTKSAEYREKEVSTTKLLEAPPGPTTTTTTTTITVPVPPSPKSASPPPPAESVHGSVRESVRESKTTEEISHKPLSEAPRSVREWDGLTAHSGTTHRSRSTKRRSVSRIRAPDDEVIIEKKTIIKERSPSPIRRRSVSRRRSRSIRRRASSSDEEFVQRRIIREEDIDESNSIHIGPLALVRDHPRSDREIQEEIERLRSERRRARSRRRSRDDDFEYVRIERRASRSPSIGRREVMVERRGDDLMLVREKPEKERGKSLPRPPSARDIRGMMYTLT